MWEEGKRTGSAQGEVPWSSLRTRHLSKDFMEGRESAFTYLGLVLQAEEVNRTKTQKLKLA